MDTRSDKDILNGFCNGVKNGGSLNCPGKTKHRILTSSNGQNTALDATNEIAPFIPTRLQLLTDLANLCTLLGAVLATIAMACMWKNKYYLGMLLNVSANIADIIDGPIARSFSSRHPTFSTIGSKLDCYSDLISHFVVPASLLMNLSDMHPICTALAALYICSGIVRQSYFEVTGRCNNGTCIYGLTSDYMVAIYCIAMHLSPIIGFRLMVLVLSAAIVIMMFASLTFSLRSRRYDGIDLYGVILFNVLLWFSCLILSIYAVGDFAAVSTLLFVIQMILAYPLYFRFVELNT